MAKKKAATRRPTPKRSPVRGPAKGRSKVNGAESKSPRPKRAQRAAGPRSQTLPGMEQARNRRLDNFCEAIAEHRAAKNDAAQREASDINGALQEMQRSGQTVYKHAGVELARVPGAEKLRVRLVEGEGDADASDLETGDGEAADAGGEFAEERREAVEGLGAEG